MVACGCSKKNDATPANTTLTYSNHTPAPIKVELNGKQSVILQSGDSIVFTGKPGDELSGGATTSGTTGSGALIGVGEPQNWLLYNVFPSNGNFGTSINADAHFFLLQVINQSAYTITKIYVNYGLAHQSLDNVSIPNDGKTYNIAYYFGFKNSNVRLESGTTYWYQPSLDLPFSQNQVFTFTVN